MSLAFKANLKGADEMAKFLKQFPIGLREKILLSAARAGANVLRDEMRRRTPGGGLLAWRYRRTTRIPGRLRKSITVRRDRAASKGSVVLLVGLFKKGFYGRFLEFGTRYIKARPWMRPALDTAAARALERQGKVLGDQIEKRARALAGRLDKSGLIKRRRGKR